MVNVRTSKTTQKDNMAKRQDGKKTTWQKDKNDKKDNPTGDLSFSHPPHGYDPPPE
jgi:hypothetical protein|tara:strand:+ start:269 stop:436 length:168 start_codon:yes stop_codon:yes gene_type:complete